MTEDLEYITNFFEKNFTKEQWDLVEKNSSKYHEGVGCDYCYTCFYERKKKVKADIQIDKLGRVVGVCNKHAVSFSKMIDCGLQICRKVFDDKEEAKKVVNGTVGLANKILNGEKIKMTRFCQWCNLGDENIMKRCSGCKIVHYCSKECQLKDWKNGHKELCLKS